MNITKLSPKNITKLSPNQDTSYAIPSNITVYRYLEDSITPNIRFTAQLKLKENDMEDMKPVDCLPESLQIKNIAYCDKPGKEKVILVFKDGSKVIKKMCKGDTFDLNIGVALAFMEKVCGSKTQYHKMIQKKLPKNK
jgi:hypothetical protein